MHNHPVRTRSFKIISIILIISILLISYSFQSTFKNNSEIKTIIKFLYMFNVFFLLSSFAILSQKINLNIFSNKLNLNLMIVFGFLYKFIFFSYFKLDIIYYFSLKDYLVNFLTFFLISVLILSIFIVTISLLNVKYDVFKQFINTFSSICFKSKPNLYSTPYFIKLILILYISVFLFYFFHSFNLIDINSIFVFSSFISGLIIFIIISFFKALDNQIMSNNLNNSIFLIYIFFINFIINSAFLNSYYIIGSSKSTLDKTMESKLYKNKKIFKIESTENYEFYISKPNNNLLIFKRNYNIINENP